MCKCMYVYIYIHVYVCIYSNTYKFHNLHFHILFSRHSVIHSCSVCHSDFVFFCVVVACKCTRFSTISWIACSDYFFYRWCSGVNGSATVRLWGVWATNSTWLETHVIYDEVMLHLWMSHWTQMNESWHTDAWVVSHMNAWANSIWLELHVMNHCDTCDESFMHVLRNMWWIIYTCVKTHMTNHCKPYDESFLHVCDESFTYVRGRIRQIMVIRVMNCLCMCWETCDESFTHVWWHIWRIIATRVINCVYLCCDESFTHVWRLIWWIIVIRVINRLCMCWDTCENHLHMCEDPYDESLWRVWWIVYTCVVMSHLHMCEVIYDEESCSTYEWVLV